MPLCRIYIGLVYLKMGNKIFDMYISVKYDANKYYDDPSVVLHF